MKEILSYIIILTISELYYLYNQKISTLKLNLYLNDSYNRILYIFYMVPSIFL